MSWQEGDLALCIRQGDWFYKDNGHVCNDYLHPKSGQILTVKSVIIWNSIEGLIFARGYYPYGYESKFFVKVTPEEDLESIEKYNDNTLKTSPYEFTEPTVRFMEKYRMVWG